MDFGEENYEMPDELFEVSIENLGVIDINVLQKEINRKINYLSNEAKAVVRRKHHTEKKNQLLRREVVSTGSVLS